MSAGLLRQATYGTARLGVYSALVDQTTGLNGVPPPLWLKAAAGLTAGACGAVVGNPAEVALIRMSADGAASPGQRRNYKHALNALGRIAHEEGIATLWRGVGATILRSMVVGDTI